MRKKDTSTRTRTHTHRAKSFFIVVAVTSLSQGRQMTKTDTYDGESFYAWWRHPYPLLIVWCMHRDVAEVVSNKACVTNALPATRKNPNVLLWMFWRCLGSYANQNTSNLIHTSTQCQPVLIFQTGAPSCRGIRRRVKDV